MNWKTFFKELKNWHLNVKPANFANDKYASSALVKRNPYLVVFLALFSIVLVMTYIMVMFYIISKIM